VFFHSHLAAITVVSRPEAPLVHRGPTVTSGRDGSPGGLRAARHRDSPLVHLGEELK
jgi:hypothetical protein